MPNPLSPERRAELMERIKPLCDPFEVFMAEDGHPAIRGKPPEKLAHQVIYTLAPELAERDHLEEALRLAKVGLVGSLRHGFDSCNAGLSEACFVCEGLAAVGSALGESWPRRSERDRG